jgi:alpha-methylacyl-CoA racemase
MRYAQEDAVVGTTPVKKGERLLLAYLSGNRDEAAFPDPFRFDVRRPNAEDHVAFGIGVHFCLGAHLARMELRAFFRELLPRLEAIELAASPSTPPRRSSAARSASPSATAFRAPTLRYDMPGPLSGIKVIELAGIGPGPFCGMMLSDMGAEVLRVDRAQSVRPGASTSEGGACRRARARARSVGVDLKQRAGVETVLRLAEKADVLYEGFRPGVTERLGLGPDVCLARNPRLVYGRMTGWGQDGPLAHAAGHDINYIAMTGALHAIGRKGERPVPPLNLVGDFGGGGLDPGVRHRLRARRARALGEGPGGRRGDGRRRRRAHGDHLRRAPLRMVEGRARRQHARHRRALLRHLRDEGREVRLDRLDRAAVLRAAARAHRARRPGPAAPVRCERWPEMHERLAAIFRTKTRDEWCKIMEGTDVCFAPVLTIGEAPHSAHAKARRAFVEVGGVVQPGPAPRFSRTGAELGRPPAWPGEHTDEALRDWGFRADEIAELRGAGAIA